MLVGRLSWLDIIITALLRDLSSSSRLKVELEGLVRLNGYREGMLTG